MNDEELRARVLALEARLVRLEAQLATRPGPAPTAAPWPVAAAAAPVDLDERARSGQPAARHDQRRRPAEPPPLPGAAPTATGSGPTATATGCDDDATPQRQQPMDGPHQAGRRGKTGSDLERFVGLAVLGRVGIAAVLLAAAYFGQLGWARLGPGARATLVYLGGMALVGIGSCLRSRVTTRYVALLWGGGTAMTYLAGVLAHLRYAVIGSETAVVSLLLSAALGQFLACRLGLQSLATVALGGAYAAPMLVGTPSASPTAFFVLLLALHAWAAWLEWRWRWHAARALAVAATVLQVVAWYGQRGAGPVWAFAAHIEVVWIALLAPEVLAALQRRHVAWPRSVLIGLGGIAAHGSVFAHSWRPQQPHGLALLLSLLSLAVGGWLVGRAEQLGAWIARAGSVVLPFGLFVWIASWEPPRTAGYWVGGLLAAAMLLQASRRWTRVGELGTLLAGLVAVSIALPTSTTSRHCAVAVVATFAWLPVASRLAVARVSGLLLATSMALLLVARTDSFRGAQAQWLSLGLAFASAVATLGAFLAARDRDRVLAWVATGLHALLGLAWAWLAFRDQAAAGAAAGIPLWNLRSAALGALVLLTISAHQRLPASDAAPRAVLAATALVAVYFGGLLELLDYVAEWTFGPRAVASSLYTLAFAAALLVGGFVRRLPALRWTALAMFGLTAIKVVAHDLREVETPGRVLATGVLGGVLLLAAWAYARRQRQAA